MARIRHTKIIPLDAFRSNSKHWNVLSEKVRYTGNPHHKRSPADFGLDPPSSARKGKTLCDAVEVFAKDGAKQIAQNILKDAFRKGLFSEQLRGNWPQKVWGLAEDGTLLEGMLDGKGLGTYHGYPAEVDRHLLEEIKKRNANERFSG